VKVLGPAVGRIRQPVAVRVCSNIAFEQVKWLPSAAVPVWCRHGLRAVGLDATAHVPGHRDTWDS